MASTEFFGEIKAVSSRGNLYNFTNASVKSGAAKGETAVTAVKVEVKDKVGNVASWGKNNKYPQEVLAEAKKNSSVLSGLRLRRQTHYGGGITFMEANVTEDGKQAPKVVPMTDTRLTGMTDFFERSQVSRFTQEIIADLEWWAIAFPEYILSNDFTQINRVKRHNAAWCRYEMMNPSTGLVENLYISEKFGKSSVSEDSEFIAKVPLIDSYWSADEVKEYCKAKRIHKFIRPIFYPLIDEAYYPEAEWHSVIKSRWLEVANSIPEYKINMFLNQLTSIFLIEIDERYFEQKYKDEWYKYTIEKRIEIRKAVIETIDQNLTGSANAGKSIQSMKIWDPETKTSISAITITAIDNKLKDGMYMPEATAATQEMFNGLGVDPSLTGAGIPGSSLGAGSGSDKTAAFNILQALMKTNRDYSLDPIKFVRNFNGWDRTIYPIYENTMLTTLDKNPTGSQKTT